MVYSESELQKLHQIELSILDEIIRICELNHLTYFSVGGTTLGAIRHNGFIPWDDDIDIGMLRDDYEQFLKIAPTQLKSGYVLQHFSTEKNMPTYFAKVRKDGTEFVENYFKDLKMHHGVFLDIMPFDYIPEDMEHRRKYRRSAQFWGQLYISKTLKTTCSTVPVKHRTLANISRGILHILLMPVSKNWLFNKLDHILSQYNHSGSRMVSSRGIPAFECMEKDILPVRKHKFETMEICIPTNADKVLTTQYGDYMQFPPEDQRVSHAPYRINLG